MGFQTGPEHLTQLWYRGLISSGLEQGILASLTSRAVDGTDVMLLATLGTRMKFALIRHSTLHTYRQSIRYLIYSLARIILDVSENLIIPHCSKPVEAVLGGHSAFEAFVHFISLFIELQCALYAGFYFYVQEQAGLGIMYHDSYDSERASFFFVERSWFSLHQKRQSVGLCILYDMMA